MSRIFIFFILLFFGFQQIIKSQDWVTTFKSCFEYVQIHEIESITTGSFSIANGDTYYDLPPFVRISLSAHPVEASNIRIEVWLPEKGWNGRFLATGNGGGAGNILYYRLADGLRRGFAVANTDMGTSVGVNNATNNLEVWKDFGYRATHEMTIIAKKIIEEYYSRPIAYSYFKGCSTGGQQALMEAQRFPYDYNGIIAGAPANNRTHLHISFLWNYLQAKSVGSSFTQEQLEYVVTEILKANRGKDGGAPADDFLTDPRMADFDCSCLDASIFTAQQITALENIVNGTINPATGENIYTAFPLGSESRGNGLLHQQSENGVRGLLYPIRWYGGGDYDLSTFDFNNDIRKMDSILAPILNANNPDLSAFKDNGGKLLMYSGTTDALVPFQDALHYYERVVAHQGNLENTQSFFRYFLVPGMDHCNSGPGPNEFGQSLRGDTPLDAQNDILLALMKWVEEGIAPEKMIATRYIEDNPAKGIEMQRPIYPYPLFPHFTGGDPTQYINYKPEVHPMGNVMEPADKYLK